MANSSAMHSTMTVKKSTAGRRRHLKQMQERILNKLETGWHNSYEPNLGSFNE